MDLSLNQTRVIGCLLEKEVTTPDQYPLSLNALMLACNQKSNRDPVMQLDESEVQQVLDELAQKRLIREESGFGSRVVKYKHRFCNTEFSDLQLTDQELAIICTLFLRGPQTPGELRTRTNRMCKFQDVQETESVLLNLVKRDSGALVAKLEREPGKRESRYAHLFSGEVQSVVVETSTQSDVQTSDADISRIQHLEQRVEQLEAVISDLKAKLEG